MIFDISQFQNPAFHILGRYFCTAIPSNFCSFLKLVKPPIYTHNANLVTRYSGTLTVLGRVSNVAPSKLTFFSPFWKETSILILRSNNNP